MSLKLGVIGTGAIGQDHIRRCSQTLLNSQVVAVTDINLAQAAKVVADLKLTAEVYPDGHALIKAPDVEAILVTSWGPSHEEFVLAAIAAGKPVFCEKPLAVTAEGCRKIVEAEVAHGKRLVQVGFMRPYDEGYRALKSVIDSGQIGEPLMLHCAHRNPSVGENYKTDMAITDTLIHELDVLRWLLADDYVSVQVVFPARAARPWLTCAIRRSSCWKPPRARGSTSRCSSIASTVTTSNAKWWGDRHRQAAGTVPGATSSGAKLSNAILMDWKDRFIAAYDVELQAFIDGVRAGQVGGPSAWDGFAAAVAADACIEAQQSGQIVKVDLPERPRFYG